MSVLEVVNYPHPVLREMAAPVTKFDDDLVRLAQDMFDTMIDYNGIGLAAPQINQSLRLLVASYEKDNLVLVNPEIIASSGEAVGEEGCLSLPDVQVNVKRATKIKVKAQTLAGDTIEFEKKGLMAIIIQHEIDHLDGVLIIDKEEK